MILAALLATGLAGQTMFSIIGTVRNPAGRPVPAVRVSLLDEDQSRIRTVFADSSGRFRFQRLRESRVMVRVETVGLPYEEQTQEVELRSLTPRSTSTEEPFHLDFILKPRKDARPPEAGPAVVFYQEISDAARQQYESGMELLRKNKPDLALEAFHKSIELFPDYYAAREVLGAEYVKREQYEQAVPILVRAIGIHSAPKSLYALGVAWVKLRRFTDAVGVLRQAALMDARNANVHMMLGIAYGNIGALDRSEESLKAAYRIGGSEAADAHLYLAGIYDKRGDYSAAVRELELYLKEARGLKDTRQIRSMIESLKRKKL